MAEIVKKLVARSAKSGAGGVPGSLQPHQDRELRVVIEAESLDGMEETGNGDAGAARGQYVLYHL
jgi:hypothetical protein